MQSWHKHTPVPALSTAMAHFSPPLFQPKMQVLATIPGKNSSRSRERAHAIILSLQNIKHLAEKSLKLHLGGRGETLAVEGSWSEEMASETLMILLHEDHGMPFQTSQ